MTDHLQPITRIARSPLFWLVLATAALYQMALAPHWKPTWDSATYISLAQALAQGDGYTYMGYPHTKYPPGFPLLLAPIELLFGHDYWLMRFVVMGCAVASVGLSYLLVRRRSGAIMGLGIAVMTAGSYALLLESTQILSDIPFMVASLGALLAADRYLRRLDRRDLVLLMVLVVVACSMRLIGAALALAVAAALISHPGSRPRRIRMRHGILVVGVVGVMVSGWMGRGALIQSRLPSELREAVSYEREFLLSNANIPSSTTVQWGTLVDRVRRNATYYESLLADLVTSRHAPGRTLVHLCGLLLIVGWASTWFRQRGVLEYYLFFYLCVYLLWPSRQGERFLAPVLPLLFYYLLQALILLSAWIRNAGQRWVQRGRGGASAEAGADWVAPEGPGSSVARWGVLGSLTIAYVALSVPGIRAVIREEHRDPYYSGEVAQYIEAIHWVRDNSAANSVLITDRAPWAYLLSGRTSFTSPWVDDPSAVLSSLERNGATHVIANDWGYSEIFLMPLIAAHPRRFVELHRVGGHVIYAFLGPEGVPGSSAERGQKS